MKVTLNNYEIIALNDLLSAEDSILNNKNNSLSIKILWTLDKNARKIFELNKSIQEMKQKIDMEFSDDTHSDEAEDGGRKVKPKFISEYHQKLMELYEIKEDIDFTPIHLKDLEAYEISSRDFQAIKIMIDENENEKE